MKNFLRSLAALAIISWSGLALAEVAVIVHPSASVDSLTADEISRLFMGKSKSFPNGSPAIALNQDDGSATRDVFNQEICNKSPSQYKAYWSKLVFTGTHTTHDVVANIFGEEGIFHVKFHIFRRCNKTARVDIEAHFSEGGSVFINQYFAYGIGKR